MPGPAERYRCCIVGGGPAGMMLGFLLARAGVDVIVLEKHADFLRDFRGDTVHPSTLELIHELGLLDEFLRRPHQELREIRGMVGDTELTLADFSHLPTRCRFVAFMPQWDFLDFLALHAKAYPGFAFAHAGRSHRPHHGGRARRRRARADARRRARDPGRPRRRRRRAPLAGARKGRPCGRGYRGAHGRALDAPSAPPGRPRAAGRPVRRRRDLRHAEPRRLLPMRARHSEGRLRRR